MSVALKSSVHAGSGLMLHTHDHIRSAYRDKKNPKPLDANAFSTLVKTASEVLRRHEQQLHAALNKSVTITLNGAAVTVTLKIVPDDYEPHGILKAIDEQGSEIASKRVEPDFSLTRASATAWAHKGFSG